MRLLEAETRSSCVRSIILGTLPFLAIRWISPSAIHLIRHPAFLLLPDDGVKGWEAADFYLGL
jgi:hypothetical protein